MGMTGNLATEERLAWLRARLEVDGRVRISQASSDLGVSDMTIRRDLQELEGLGLARRVRGGAVSVGPMGVPEQDRSRSRAKTRIATKLLPMVAEVGAIGMDASSTIGRVAALVESARDLTVVTNGLETFQTLYGRPGVNPLLTGGRLDMRTGSLVGPIAVATAGQVLLSGLLISAAAVHPDTGPSEPSMEEAEVKRAMIAVSDVVILAVDSSKLGSRSIAVSTGWEHITTLVTDLDPGDSRLDPFREHVAVL